MTLCDTPHNQILTPAERMILREAAHKAEQDRSWSEGSWWLLTGAPGTGKTTLLKEFEASGLNVIHDLGREEIEEWVSCGLQPDDVRHDYTAFQRRVLSRALSAMAGVDRDSLVIFDYGVAEGLAFMKIDGIAWTMEFIEAAVSIRFKQVFVLDLLPEDAIRSDRNRIHTFQERKLLDQVISEIYRAIGHEPIRVPPLLPRDRLMWVTQRATGHFER